MTAPQGGIYFHALCGIWARAWHSEPCTAWRGRGGGSVDAGGRLVSAWFQRETRRVPTAHVARVPVPSQSKSSKETSPLANGELLPFVTILDDSFHMAVSQGYSSLAP